MASRLNLEVDQGADTPVVLVFKNADETDADFTGSQFRMQLRRFIDDDKCADELTTENGRIEFEGSAVTLHFPASVTSAMKAAAYVYDLEHVSASGYVTRLVEGEVRIRREVTR
jgi:hypothetical protein